MVRDSPVPRGVQDDPDRDPFPQEGEVRGRLLRQGSAGALPYRPGLLCVFCVRACVFRVLLAGVVWCVHVLWFWTLVVLVVRRLVC